MAGLADEFRGRLTCFGLQLSMVSPDIPGYTKFRHTIEAAANTDNL